MNALLQRLRLRHLLFALPFSWILVLIYAYYTNPATSVLALPGMLLLLFSSFICTITPPLYYLEQMLFRQRYQIRLPLALRQGSILSLILVLCLFLKAVGGWTWWLAPVFLLAGLILEIILLARK